MPSRALSLELLLRISAASSSRETDDRSKNLYTLEVLERTKAQVQTVPILHECCPGRETTTGVPLRRDDTLTGKEKPVQKKEGREKKK